MTSTAHRHELDVDYSERAGFLTGRNAAIQDWKFRKEKKEGDFKRLVWRLQAKKCWANKDPERKARIREGRERWRLANRERHQAAVNKSKRKRRADPRKWRAELAEKKARRAIERVARRAATIYTCVDCGTQWSPAVGRIPTRPPKRCSNKCNQPARREKARLAMRRFRAKKKGCP